MAHTRHDRTLASLVKLQREIGKRRWIIDEDDKIAVAVQAKVLIALEAVIDAIEIVQNA